MTRQLLEAQLAAMRAQSLALVASVNATLALLAATPDAAPESTPSEPPVPDVVGVCGHPHQHREPAPRMGYPLAFYCRACNTEVKTP